MYLVDTNIILEILLERERADEAEKFLRNAPAGSLFLSEFSLYSLGILLFRQNRHEVFLQIVHDLLKSSSVRLVRLSPEHMPLLAAKAQEYHLDFDDAYQYVASEVYGLTLVSFDSDFDRTPRGKKTPKEVVEAAAG